MQEFIQQTGEKVLARRDLSYKEAIQLINIDSQNVEELRFLQQTADEIRSKFNGNKVDLCSIYNVKSGRCSENCKFCAQSAHYSTGVEEHDISDYKLILNRAEEMYNAGVHRFSLVSSGKGLNQKDTDKLVKIYQQLSQDTKINLCASHGIISFEQAVALKNAGVHRYHHNLETSRDYYDNICTTHTFDDRINTIKNAQQAGLDVCCGGIIGMGESPEDRVKMAFNIKALNIQSVPINVLNPIPGTPLGDQPILSPAEILKTVAVFRFILPSATIRFAGGRKALHTFQESGFRSGVNGAIVGDYLTTVGNDIAADKMMIKKLGFDID